MVCDVSGAVAWHSYGSKLLIIWGGLTVTNYASNGKHAEIHVVELISRLFCAWLPLTAVLAIPIWQAAVCARLCPKLHVMPQKHHECCSFEAVTCHTLVASDHVCCRTHTDIMGTASATLEAPTGMYLTTVPRNAALSDTLQIALHRQHCMALHCKRCTALTALHCTVRITLHCTDTLYCTTLHCTTLHALHCTVLYTLH